MTTKAERLRSLNEEYTGCTRCQLCAHRKPNGVVHGVGDPNAKIMVIGDYPSEDDEKMGVPFYSQSTSGQILNMQLKSCTLLRKNLWITNVVLCRPSIDGDKGRTPTKTEVAACSDRLHREILTVDPLVLLIMGDSALRYLLRSNAKSSDLVGKVHEVVIPFQGGEARYTAFALSHPVTLSREDSGWSSNGPSRRMTDFMRLAAQAVKFIEELKDAPTPALGRTTPPFCGNPVTDTETL